MKRSLLNFLTYPLFLFLCFSIWISCEKEDDVKATVSVTGISFSAHTLTLKEGEKKSITATISPEEATKDITKDDLGITISNYGIADRAIVTVSIDSFTNGKATVSIEAKKFGEAELRLFINNIKDIDKKAALIVVVQAKDVDGKVTKITLNKKELSLAVGKYPVGVVNNKETLSYTADPDDAKDTTVTWSSSDEDIATVSDDGTVTAVEVGEANIIATSNSSPTVADTCKVMVIIPITSIRISSSTLVLAGGKSEQLTATIEPEDATNKNVIWSSSDEDIATVSDDGTVTAVEVGEANIIVSTEDGNKTDTCEVTVKEFTDLERIILSGEVPGTELANYTDPFVHYLFSRYRAEATLVAKYVKEGGLGDGSSWDKPDSSLKKVLDGITDASSNKVYVILLGTGTYDPGEEMSMKNNVAIVGGLIPDTYEFSTTDTTTLSGGPGQIGTHRIFKNDVPTDAINNTACLYGVTIANGSVNNASGAGMYNNSASPALRKVIFSKNNASGTGNGGGMFNTGTSRPELEDVHFVLNFAFYGGGIYNNAGSSIKMNRGSFIGNVGLTHGGGIYNTGTEYSGLPVELYNVTFMSNNGTNDGGAIYSNRIGAATTSLMVLVNNYFSLNSATNAGNTGEGSAMHLKSQGTYTIVNSIFWNNSQNPSFTNVNDAGNQIYARGSGTININLYNSIFSAAGVGDIVSGTAVTNAVTNQGGFTIDNTTTTINYGDIITSDPGVIFTPTAGAFVTLSLPSTSPAVDKGLYVQEESGTYYYSTNNTTWYTDLTNSSVTTTLPRTASFLIIADQYGNVRSGRPDLGAFEGM